MEQIISYKTQGAAIRCRANWLELGEKNSKYFFALEEHRDNRKNLSRLRTLEGNITIKQQKISETLTSFFSKLYTTDNIEMNEQYLEDIRDTAPKLSTQDRTKLDRVIDMDELDLSFKKMKINKCPGLDGYTVEFFHCFWPELRVLLHNVFQEAIMQGRIQGGPGPGPPLDHQK